MQEEEFRAAAKADFSRPLLQWTRIELWLKRAEQINGEAIIPAINELRYASRQLFNALRLFDSTPLTDQDIRRISKRIIVAEQYLLNSEHDIYDSIVTFYRAVINDIENRYGRNIITSHFIRYPMLVEHVKNCEDLIADARHNYENRAHNYSRIRDQYIPEISSMHEGLLDAQVSAQEEINRTRSELIIAEGRASLSFWIVILTLPLAIIGVALPVYLWVVTPQRYCEVHSNTFILNWICGKP
jgi:hypothetical protein